MTLKTNKNGLRQDESVQQNAFSSGNDEAGEPSGAAGGVIFGAKGADDHWLAAREDDCSGIVLAAASRAERNVQGASSAHCTGYSVLGEGEGIRFQGESLTEVNHFYVLNMMKNVVEMREQVRFFFGWNPKKQKQHVFDVVATLACGQCIAFAIKPEHRLLSGKFEAVMQEVAWWAYKTDFADDVRILTEADLDPVELHNAKVLAAVRGIDPEADAVATVALQALPEGGGLSLQELTLATGMGARGYRALIRLLRKSQARLQNRERICPQSVIVNVGSSKTVQHLPDRHELIVQWRPYLTAA